MPDTHVRDIHCNGRHPSLPEVGQDGIYMNTCSPLTAPESLKILTRKGIVKLCPPGLVPYAYKALQLFLAHGELGTAGHYLMVAPHVTSGTHMRLRDVIVFQLDFAHEFPFATLPWWRQFFLRYVWSLFETYSLYG